MTSVSKCRMLPLGKEKMGAGGGKTHIDDTKLELSSVCTFRLELEPHHENMKHIPPLFGTRCSSVESLEMDGALAARGRDLSRGRVDLHLQFMHLQRGDAALRPRSER